jgi:hypothetical protein
MGMKWSGNWRSLLSISITAADAGALSSMAESKWKIDYVNTISEPSRMGRPQTKSRSLVVKPPDDGDGNVLILP